MGAGFLVAQEDNIVVGYIIFWIRFEDEGHIISWQWIKIIERKLDPNGGNST